MQACALCRVHHMCPWCSSSVANAYRALQGNDQLLTHVFYCSVPHRGEYTAEERAAGMHSASLKFAYESRSQRGSRRGTKDVDNGLGFKDAKPATPAAGTVSV